MRSRLIFQLRNRGAQLPFHHQGLIRQSLEDWLGDDFSQRTPLAFSSLKGQTKVGRSGLQYFSSRVTVVVGGLEQEVLDTLFDRVLTQETVNIGELELRPEVVENEEEVTFEEKVKYLCLSPMVLFPVGTPSDEAARFVSPTDDEFSDLLYESTLARMEATGRYSPEEIESFFRFQVVADGDYLQRLMENEKKFSRIYTINQGGQEREVRGYTFPFTLYADPKVQEFLFHTGMGEGTGHGMGMLDLAGVDNTKRTFVYKRKDRPRQAPTILVA